MFNAIVFAAGFWVHFSSGGSSSYVLVIFPSMYKMGHVVMQFIAVSTHTHTHLCVFVEVLGPDCV